MNRRFIVALGLLLIAAPAAAASYADGNFLDADWSATILAQSGPPVSFAAARVTSGGNPDAYRRLSHTYGGFGDITTGHLLESAVYDPAAQGALAEVDVAFDLLLLSGGSSGTVAYGALLEQAGSFYQAGFELSTATWTSHSLEGLTAASFGKVSGPGAATPDFSAGGAPITFGYYASNGTGLASQTSTLSGIDNWEVTVTAAIPEPETYALLLAGLGLLGFAARRRSGA
jgi:hypothetical protein